MLKFIIGAVAGVVAYKHYMAAQTNNERVRVMAPVIRPPESSTLVVR